MIVLCHIPSGMPVSLTRFVYRMQFDEEKRFLFRNKVAAILNAWPETKNLGTSFPLPFT